MTTSSVNTLAQPLGEMPPEAIIFGRTEAMQAVRDRLTKLASANVPVLIQGESGTGKDIIARMIHAASPWRTGPWVKVNCPAIPGTLLESELFGYEKGAFTGAYGMKPGRVEMAHRGTLFLDEISELDMSLQSKLLQLLQDGQFCRIGAQEDKKVEVRVVCATNRKLEQEISLIPIPESIVGKVPNLPVRDKGDRRLLSGTVPVDREIFRKIVVRESRIPLLKVEDFSTQGWTDRCYYEVCTDPAIYAALEKEKETRKAAKA